eukprot:6184828-Pleurochrysis_carterae.AAC.2
MMAPPHKRTTQPMVVGGSILGVKYAGGVMVAADTLASYGSLARFEGVERVAQVPGMPVLLADVRDKIGAFCQQPLIMRLRKSQTAEHTIDPSTETL